MIIHDWQFYLRKKRKKGFLKTITFLERGNKITGRGLINDYRRLGS